VQGEISIVVDSLNGAERGQGGWGAAEPDVAERVAARVVPDEDDRLGRRVEP
jgi:hypothetical protein